jgi:hypothetical protein
MSTDQTPIELRKAATCLPMEADLGDAELLQFALCFAGGRGPDPTVEKLLAEFGDVEIILASEPEDLRTRGGLSNRAVAVLKLLHAFRRDNRRGRLLH